MTPKLNIESALFVLFFISATILAGAHYLALSFHLYWQYLWFDIPMHLLGGAVVGLGFLSFFGHGKFGSHVKYTILAALLVGISWEIFEIINEISLTREQSIVGDTILDLIMDILGGALAFYLARSIVTLDT